jgi:hypothetical protein
LDWNHLVQDRVQWWQAAEMVMNHRVSHREERFLKSWVTVSFWRRPQHHRVINYSRKRTLNFLCVTSVKRWILSPYKASPQPIRHGYMIATCSCTADTWKDLQRTQLSTVNIKTWWRHRQDTCTHGLKENICANWRRLEKR